jgi:integrase
MKIRYFEKRGQVWLDFRTPDGERKRVPSGFSVMQQSEAVRNAPAIIAKALGAQAVPNAPAKAKVPVAGPTVAEAFRLALRTREQWITSKSKGTLQGTFDQLGIDPATPTAALTRDYVRALRERWMAEPGKRADTKLSPSTINHRLSMLSVLLEVADLPPHTVKHLSTKGNARHRRVTDEDFARCAEWAAEQARLGRSGAAEFARLLPAGLETGARLSELLDLTRPDVSAVSATFRDTKNGLTRTIPLRPRAAAALAGEGKPFPTLTVDRVTTLWALMRADLGLAQDHRFVFHLLRHECASRFADEGKGSHFIKSWLGHESIVTSESYVNMSLGALAAGAGVSLLKGVE